MAGEDAADRAAALAAGVTTSAAAAGCVACVFGVCEPGHAALGVLEHDAAVVLDRRGLAAVHGVFWLDDGEVARGAACVCAWGH